MKVLFQFQNILGAAEYVQHIINLYGPTIIGSCEIVPKENFVSLAVLVLEQPEGFDIVNYASRYGGEEL